MKKKKKKKKKKKRAPIALLASPSLLLSSVLRGEGVSLPAKKNQEQEEQPPTEVELGGFQHMAASHRGALCWASFEVAYRARRNPSARRLQPVDSYFIISKIQTRSWAGIYGAVGPSWLGGGNRCFPDIAPPVWVATPQWNLIDLCLTIMHGVRFPQTPFRIDGALQI